MNVKEELLKIILIIFISVLLGSIIGCGTDENETTTSSASEYISEREPVNRLIGTWVYEDGGSCGVGIEVSETKYAVMVICMTGPRSATLSYKIIEFDASEQQFEGYIVESTCDNVGMFHEMYHSITNETMAISTDTGLITGLKKIVPSNEEEVSYSYTYGCYINGYFQPTQIYK